MNDRTGTPPLRPLDELAAFDAMRRFLETWWEVGGKSEDVIANMLSSMERTRGAGGSASSGPPRDLALWDDWREAVSFAFHNGSAPSNDLVISDS